MTHRTTTADRQESPFLPPLGNTGVETVSAHVSWLHGTARASDEAAVGWDHVKLLQGETGASTTMDAGGLHYGKGVRADDWSWLVRWESLSASGRGLVYVETRQSVWEAHPAPPALLGRLLATVRPARIDIASDVADGDRPASLFLRRESAWTRTRRGSWLLTQRGDGGETLAIGSRTSDRFLRIYVKGERLIRHELELKGAVARGSAGSLQGGADPGLVFAAEYGRIVRWP